MEPEDDDSDDRIGDKKKSFQPTSEDDDDEMIIFGDSDDGSRVFRLEVASIMAGNGATVVKMEPEQTLDSIVE
ncbi:MAG: hypothetical protein SGBAC_000500 [Bacillariaceae sp.]